MNKNRQPVGVFGCGEGKSPRQLLWRKSTSARPIRH